jgi:hypothetical protein
MWMQTLFPLTNTSSSGANFCDFSNFFILFENRVSWSADVPCTKGQSIYHNVNKKSSDNPKLHNNQCTDCRSRNERQSSKRRGKTCIPGMALDKLREQMKISSVLVPEETIKYHALHSKTLAER